MKIATIPLLTRRNAAIRRIKVLFTCQPDGDFKSPNHALLHGIIAQAVRDLGDPAYYKDARRFLEHDTTHWIADACRRLGIFEPPAPDKLSKDFTERRRLKLLQLQNTTAKLKRLEDEITGGLTSYDLL